MVRLSYLTFLLPMLTACTARLATLEGPPARGVVAELLEPLPVVAPEGEAAQAKPPPTALPSPAKSKPRRAAAPAAAPVSQPLQSEPPLPPDLDTQPVEELVVRADSLTGYWMLIAPRIVDVDVGLFSGIQIRYGGEMGDRNICWLDQKGKSVSALCAAGVVLKSGDGSVDQDGISLRWWMGPGTANFSGKFNQAGEIRGGFSGGVIGMSLTGDVPAGMRRIDLPNPASAPNRPSADLIKAVWEDVRQGHLTEGRYEGSAVKRVNQGLTPEIAAEAPKSMLFLGRILVHWRKEQRETVQDVYQVTTDSGPKLCRVAANEQGQVVDFGCKALDVKKN
jgi:hypothetical protein